MSLSGKGKHGRGSDMSDPTGGSFSKIKPCHKNPSKYVNAMTRAGRRALRKKIQERGSRRWLAGDER